MNSLLNICVFGRAVVIGSVMMSSLVARAQLTAYEPFDYAPVGADVNGLAGGGRFGFSAGWVGNSTFDLATPGGLSSPVSMAPALGNRVTADAFGANRDLDRVLAESIGADNTARYFSFLMQAEDVVGAGAFDGWFAFVLRAGGRNVTVGKASFRGEYKVEGNSGEIGFSTVPVVANQSHFFVLRADFRPGADLFRLYIDPQTGQPEPATASAVMSTFDVGPVTAVGISGPGAFGFDELRIGNSWADVTPVPEPSGFVLGLLFTAFGMLSLRHVRRNQGH